MLEKRFNEINAAYSVSQPISIKILVETWIQTQSCLRGRCLFRRALGQRLSGVPKAVRFSAGVNRATPSNLLLIDIPRLDKLAEPRPSTTRFQTRVPFYAATFTRLASLDKVALDSLRPDWRDASMIAFQLMPFRNISTMAALRLVSSGRP